MESKKLFEEKDIEEYAGATKKECHNWYQSVIGGCYGKLILGQLTRC